MARIRVLSRVLLLLFLPKCVYPLPHPTRTTHKKTHSEQKACMRVLRPSICSSSSSSSSLLFSSLFPTATPTASRYTVLPSSRLTRSALKSIPVARAFSLHHSLVPRITTTAPTSRHPVDSRLTSASSAVTFALPTGQHLLASRSTPLCSSNNNFRPRYSSRLIPCSTHISSIASYSTMAKIIDGKAIAQ